MNQNIWLRTGFVALLVAATTGASIVACDGDDDAKTTPTPVQDSAPPMDSPVVVVSDAGDAGSSEITVPKVILIHGANEAGPVRLCIATKADGTPQVPANILGFAPLPFDTATSALPPGFGAVLPLRDLNVSKFNLVPVVIKVSALNAIGAQGRNKSCGQVLAEADAGGLTKDVDYWVLPEVSKADFAEKNTYAAVVVGCPGGLTETTPPSGRLAKCGAGYDPAMHNFRLQTYKLDRTGGGAGNSVQVVHGAPAIDVATTALGVQPFIATGTPADAGPPGFVNPVFPLGDASVTYAAQAPSKAAAPVPGAKTTAPIDYAKAVIGVRIVANDSNLVQPVSVAQLISAGGKADPTFFKAGRAFTFIAVGDAQQPAQTDAGAFNPLSAHFLVFDNDPEVPMLPQ